MSELARFPTVLSACPPSNADWHPLITGHNLALQLHEIFLLFLWREIGLLRDDYDSAIELLCESGILFEASSFGALKN